MSLRLGRQCCHRSFRNTTGERKRIFRNDVVSRFGRGEEEPPPPASDRGRGSRKYARAKGPTPEHTPLFWGTTPRPSFLAASVRYTAVVPKCNAQSSSPEKVVAMRTKPRDHRRRFARLDRFSFQNRIIRMPSSFFPIHGEVCRGRSQILFVSRKICKRAFFKVVSSRHIIFSPILAFQKRALFPIVFVRRRTKEK